MNAIPNWQTAVLVASALIGGPIALVVLSNAVIDFFIGRDRRP